MTCKKCGCILKKGQLLCPNCGEEIFMVPDYKSSKEPEYELSSEFKEEISHLQEENLDNLQEEQDYEEEEVTVQNNKNIIRIIMGAIFVLALTVLIVILMVWNNSFSFQMLRGNTAYNLGNYEKAIKHYDRARALDKGNMDVLLALGNSYTKLGQNEKAEEIFNFLIQNNPEEKEYYDCLISLYIKNNKYEEVALLILNIKDNGLRKYLEASFGEFTAPKVFFSKSPGPYDDYIELDLKCNGNGEIYYTLDNEDPKIAGIKYEKPIALEKGSHFVKAVFKNKYGVFGDISMGNFEIMMKSPDEPIISEDSGVFNTPVLVRVISDSNVNVFYTTDGSDPDENSRIYSAPIALPEGMTDINFVAINKDGFKSKIVSRKYEVRLNSIFTKEICYDILVGKLVENGHILDTTGTLADYPGKYIYIYRDMVPVNGMGLFVYGEYYYYSVNRTKDMTSNLYGVDMNTGIAYSVVENNGVYSLQQL